MFTMDTTFEFKGKSYRISDLSEDHRAIVAGLDAAQTKITETDDTLQLLMIARDSLVSRLNDVIAGYSPVV